MKNKYYRVCHKDTLQGLWYDYKGDFTGFIHDKFNFCKNTELKMDFDDEIVGWLSATDELFSLFHWFTIEDIKALQEHGWFIHEFETEDVKFYERFQHKIIKQDTSRVTRVININDINVVAYELIDKSKLGEVQKILTNYLIEYEIYDKDRDMTIEGNSFAKNSAFYDVFVRNGRLEELYKPIYRVKEKKEIKTQKVYTYPERELYAEVDILELLDLRLKIVTGEIKEQLCLITNSGRACCFDEYSVLDHYSEDFIDDVHNKKLRKLLNAQMEKRLSLR